MEQKHPPMPVQREITVTDIGDRMFNISTPPVGFQQYLVLGEERAALIDTGMGIGSLKKAVESVTDLPVVVINTHCHPDHAGGNAEFAPALFNPAELDVFKKMATLEFRIQDVSRMPGGQEWVPQLQPMGPEPVAARDGQIVDLGGRRLQIIFTPGHTHGSLCVFEEAAGVLFTGDNVQANATALREWNSSTVEEFHESLEKLAKLPVKRILGGHRPNDNPPDLLQRKLACAKQILDGAEGVEKTHMGQTAYEYAFEGTAIMYRREHIYKPTGSRYV